VGAKEDGEGDGHVDGEDGEHGCEDEEECVGLLQEVDTKGHPWGDRERLPVVGVGKSHCCSTEGNMRVGCREH
jgi:hypothetical protein